MVNSMFFPPSVERSSGFHQRLGAFRRGGDLDALHLGSLATQSGPWTSVVTQRNHRKTIGKWWFNGGLMGFYEILWDLPSGYD